MAINCKGCGNCTDGSFCAPWKGALEEYGGSAVRYTADGYDCALPVSMDTYNTCSFRCMYCFSNFLLRDPLKKNTFQVRAIKPSYLEKVLAGEDKHLRLDKLHPKMPFQWGALGDPFDCIERQHGVSLELMPLFAKYERPCRVSTKGGTVLTSPQYLEAFSKRPDLFWVAFSLISIDDRVLELVDKNAPNATQRLAAMKALSKLGVKTSLRFRPILPGVSDATPRHPKAWKELLYKAKEAGARAVSMEFAFVPGAMAPHIRRMWDEIKGIIGFDIVKWYNGTTSKHGACLRSLALWKEELTFAIYEETKKLGMWFGISDPHWKQLNDFGCCCGIPGDDPVFGNWMREQATNALVTARDTGCKVSAEQYIPAWAYDVKMAEMCVMTGAHNAYRRATMTWADNLRGKWNDLESPRGTLNYFEGALKPCGMKGEDVVYEYKGLKRRKLKDTPYWRINK